MLRNLFLACMVCLTLQVFVACKKDHGASNNNSNVPSYVKDSTLQLARELYLWYDQIPAHYDLSRFATPNDIMVDMRQYSKVTGYATPVDRFSFAMKKSSWDSIQAGISQDFGLSVFFLQGAINQLYVKSVERSSPAALAGIQRGWKVKAINGSTQLDTTAASIGTIVQAVWYSPSTQFTFVKPDGLEVSMQLNAAAYNTHPVMADSVLRSSTGKKVGYMVLDSFLGDSLDIAVDFNRVFTKFQNANISDLIIDLRYNGGGEVSLATLLSNYLAPAAANGNTMCSLVFNNKYTQLNETTKFSKKGNINLSRIFFIVSDHTASASELLINTLLPYMNVKLVGTYEHTYGKPVGFFPLSIGEWYAFPVSFKTVNSQGNSNYYEGFKVDKVAYDGVNKNWCDVNENCLANVLQYINTGTFSTTSIRNTGVNANGFAISSRINDQLISKSKLNITVANNVRYK